MLPRKSEAERPFNSFSCVNFSKFLVGRRGWSWLCINDASKWPRSSSLLHEVGREQPAPSGFSWPYQRPSHSVTLSTNPLFLIAVKMLKSLTSASLFPVKRMSQVHMAWLCSTLSFPLTWRGQRGSARTLRSLKASIVSVWSSARLGSNAKHEKPYLHTEMLFMFTGYSVYIAETYF